jgi:hypothetical protein
MGKTPMEIAADGTLLGPPPSSGNPEWPEAAFGGGRVRGVALPLLTGVHVKKADAGLVLEDETALAALDFLARLRVYGQGGESWVSEIWAGDPDGLVAVTLEGGIPVKVGDGRLSRRKIEALHTVLDRIRKEANPVAFVDARFRNHVIVRKS